MENLLILIFWLLLIILLYFILGIDIKEIKRSVKGNKINELVNKFPENEQICKEMLKIINNEKVNVKVNENSKDKTSLYIVLSDTIFIANIKDIFTRIQTIAHECIHSIQSKRMLIFNFLFTNIYNLYFIITLIFTILGIFKNALLQNIILTILGLIIYIVRAYLETDAMIRAKYLAKDYMEETNICTKEEIEKIISEYDKVNKIGIPAYNYLLFIRLFIKPIIYTIVCFIKYCIVK